MLRLWIRNRKVDHLPTGEIWCKQFLSLPSASRVFLDPLQRHSGHGGAGGWQVPDDCVSQPSSQPISPRWLSSWSQGSTINILIVCKLFDWRLNFWMENTFLFKIATKCKLMMMMALSLVWTRPTLWLHSRLWPGSMPSHIATEWKTKSRCKVYFRADYMLHDH